MSYKDYFRLVDDLDGSQYYKLLPEIEYFRVESDLQNRLNEWEKTIDEYEGLYIIGNKLVFTYQDKRYYYIISNNSVEWDVINEIIDDIKRYGATDIYYLIGRLD